MIGTLLKQDPARETFKVTVPLSVSAGLLLGFLQTGLPSEFGAQAPSRLEPGLLTLFICLVGLFLFFMVTAGYWTRCRSIDLALPISARRLWLVRCLSVLQAWLLPLILLILPFSLGAAFFGGDWRPDGGILAQGGQLAALLFLAMMLLQLPARRLQMIRMRAVYIVYAGAVAMACILVSVLCRPTLALSLPAAIAGGLIFIGSYLRVPAGFLLAPTPPLHDPAPAEQDAPIREPGKEAAFPWFLHRTIARLLLGMPSFWIIMVISSIYGFTVAEFHRNGRGQVIYACFLIIWFVAQLVMFSSQLGRLEHLPIRRRALLPYSVLTYLAMFFIGVAVSESMHRVMPRDRSLVCYYSCQIHVPPEFWEIAADGSPREVVAPWGERHDPRAHRLLGDAGPAVYQPFEHGPENSPEFIAWQLDRAVARVHGAPAPSGGLEHYRQRGEEISRDLGELGQCGFSLDAYKGIVSPLYRRTLAVGAMVVILISALLAVVSLRSLRPGPGRRLAKLFLPAAAIIFGGLLIASLLSRRWAFISHEFLERYPLIRIRELTESLPASLSFLWLSTALIAALSYLMIQRSFDRIEALPRKRQFLAEYDA